MFHILSRIFGFTPPLNKCSVKQDKRVRLSLEVLESRITPTSYIVDNLGDTGQGNNNTGDLRYCINQLNATGQASNTIVFMKGAQKLFGTISLQSALPAINKNVSINGPGATLMTIQGDASAQNLYGIFQIDPSNTVTISGLTVAGGYATKGGGIFNSGKLTLVNDYIQYNTATSEGGGIFNATGAGNPTLTLNGTSIDNNDSNGEGGGVYNSGTMSNNDTGGVSSGIVYNTAAIDGGGIYNLGNVQLTGVSVSLNDANTVAGDGGGVFNLSSGSFSLDNGNLNGNKAYRGGGVYNSGQMILQFGTMVQDNTANQGGGIYIASGSTNSLNTVTVSGNILEGNNAVAKGIGYLNPRTMTINGLTDNDDPGGKPVQLN